MRIILQILLFPLDLVFLTIDAWIITYRWMVRISRREKDQPCHFCRGEDHSVTPHPVRSVLKYQNGWMLRILTPCIRFRKEGGKRQAFCRQEGGFTRAPAWVPLVAIGLTTGWIVGVVGILKTSSTNSENFWGNFITFFNPGRGVSDASRDFLEMDDSRLNPEKAERYFLSGIKQFDQKNHAKALVDFKIAIQANPADPKLHFHYAKALLFTGQLVQGEQSLRRTLDYNPKHVEALLLLTELLEGREMRAEALTYAARALEIEPENKRALRMNTSLLASENKPEQVRVLLDKLMALDSENPDVLSFAARLEFGLFRDVELARGLLTRAFEINPDHVDSLMVQIAIHAQDKDMEKLDATLARVLALQPENLAALKLEADLNLNRYGIGAGIRAYSNLIGRFAGDFGLRLRYAELLLQSGNLSEGKRLAIQLTGSRVASVERSAHWMLARLHAQLRLHEEATEYGRQTLARASGNRDVQLFIAQQMLAMNRPGEARIQLEAALAQRRDDPGLITLLTESMVKMGQTSQAVTFLQEKLKATPDADVLRQRLVEIRMQSPQWAEALPDTLLLQEKYPDNAVLKNNLAFLLARSGQNLDRAMVLAESLRVQFPDNPVILDTYAFTLAAQGRHEEALPHYEEALGKAAGNPTIRYHYARSLVALGRHSDARRELNAAFMIEPKFADADEAKTLLTSLPPPGA